MNVLERSSLLLRLDLEAHGRLAEVDFVARSQLDSARASTRNFNRLPVAKDPRAVGAAVVEQTVVVGRRIADVGLRRETVLVISSSASRNTTWLRRTTR